MSRTSFLKHFFFTFESISVCYMGDCIFLLAKKIFLVHVHVYRIFFGINSEIEICFWKVKGFYLNIQFVLPLYSGYENHPVVFKFFSYNNKLSESVPNGKPRAFFYNREKLYSGRLIFHFYFQFSEYLIPKHLDSVNELYINQPLLVSATKPVHTCNMNITKKKIYTTQI